MPGLNRIVASILLSFASGVFSLQADSVKMTLSALWPESTKPNCRIEKKGVPNFGSLNKYLWRSGQPTREGYFQLAGEGLKTVVNLRVEYPQDRDSLPGGINYISIPIKDMHAPTADQAHQFLKIVSDSDNWPILVHCHAGEGRTGVMSALIRYSFDGWNHDSIKTEIRNFRIKRFWFLTFTLPMMPGQSRFLLHWEKSNPPGGYLIHTTENQPK
jgi:protein tyrosine/serine phosphatase